MLAAHPAVRRVLYPGRADHPQHALAMAQMTAGGTLVAFELSGGKAAAFRMMNAFRLIAVSNNLGDSRSLVTHPATTTHSQSDEHGLARAGISQATVRLAVGIENVDDIIADLEGAFAAIGK